MVSFISIFIWWIGYLWFLNVFVIVSVGLISIVGKLFSFMEILVVLIMNFWECVGRLFYGICFF